MKWRHLALLVGTVLLVSLFAAKAIKGMVREEALEVMLASEEAIALDQPLKFLQAPLTVTTGERVPITATLLDANLRPIVLQPIVFTCDSGSFEDAVLYTDDFSEPAIVFYSQTTTCLTDGFGEATVFWHAPPTAGPAKITVWYFGPEEGQVYSLETTVEVSDDPNLHRITLDYTQRRMVLGDPEEEENCIRLFVQVTDRQGNPVRETTVHLQTTLGELGHYSVEDWGGEGHLVLYKGTQFSVVTDENGWAEVLLFPPASPGIAVITAITSHGQARLFCIFPSIEGLHLTSDSYAAVGQHGAQIIARLYDASGQPIVGQVVTFQTTLGQLSAHQAVTDENGEASVWLISDGTEGTAVVTASAAGYSAKIYVRVFNDGDNYSCLQSPLFLLSSLQPPPFPQPQYTVRLTLNLTQVRPLGTGEPNRITVTAFVTDRNGRPVSVPLVASAYGERHSGGHIHNGRRPAGTFNPSLGSSNRNDVWRTTYTAPVVGGYETITVSVAMSVPQRSGQARITVRVPNLSYMPAGPNYRLVGQTTTHPRNHFTTSRVQQALIAIANQFAREFRGQPGYQTLEYNDISLVFGGLFDIFANWRTPHITHRIGRDVDFSNADELPSEMRRRLEEIIRRHGGDIYNEGNHWHVSF